MSRSDSGEQIYKIKTLADYQRLGERFERASDHYLLPEMNFIVRIDGRRIGSEWEKVSDLSYPYDRRIEEALRKTAARVMCCGTRVTFAFIHGDEISFLLEKSESSGTRTVSKLTSFFASSAAAFFREAMGLPLIFHTRLLQLPAEEHVLDYFFWQRKVAARNYLSHTLAGILKKRGEGDDSSTGKLTYMTEEQRLKVAADLGLPVESIQANLLTGTGIWWEEVEKPKSDQPREKNAPRRTPYRLVEQNGLSKDDAEFFEFLLDRYIGPAFAPDPVGDLVEIVQRTVI